MKIQPLLNYTSQLKQNSIKNVQTNYQTAPMAFDSVSFEGRKPRLTNEEAIRVFKSIGVKAWETCDGDLMLKEYRPKKKHIKKLEEMGIKEEALFDNVGEIDGSMDLLHSKLKAITNIRKIGGMFFPSDELSDIGKLEEVGGTFYTPMRLNDLGNLKSIGGNIYLYRTNVKDTGKLEFIGGAVLYDLSHDYIPFQTLARGGSRVIRENKRGVPRVQF